MKYRYVFHLGLVRLFQRRQEITDKLFKNICDNDYLKIHQLLPDKNSTVTNLRRKNTFIVPKINTKRFRNSFIVSNSMKSVKKRNHSSRSLIPSYY